MMTEQARIEQYQHEQRAIPPLRQGDRLSRAEFERRYEAMPHIKKAELIEGMVYMPSPVRFAHHGEPHSFMVTWICVYRAATPGLRIADNATVRLDDQNEVQPDVILFEQTDRNIHISDDDYVEGAPQLVVEVAASSAEYDARLKRRIYERNGVQEYLLWRVSEEQIDWWELQAGAYQPLMADEHGILASKVFPGLWLDTVALLANDIAKVLATLQQGINSTAHAAFVAQRES
jgi:Uma2 family endonuclease